MCGRVDQRKDWAITAICIAQVHDPIHTEHGGAGPQLRHAVDSRFEIGGFADESIRGRNDDNAMALGYNAGERSAGEDYLVVWMGMESDDGDHSAA